MEISIDNLNSEIDQFLVGGKGGFDFIRVGDLAEKLGVSAVALRFTIGIFAGFPFTFLYLLLPKTNIERKHFFFTITGLLINYFCFGADFVYNLFSIFISYVSLSLFGGTVTNVIFAFLFHTSYLTVGYVMNATDGYDVKWTTPQCILCLRLIGLAWDVYDGQQKEEHLSPDQLTTCVKYKPSLMQVFGFSYCFCGFLVGPQGFRVFVPSNFPLLSIYLKFIDGTLVDKNAKNVIHSRTIESLKRFVGACILMVLFHIFDADNRCDNLLNISFLEKPFILKVLKMGYIYYIQFAKYVIAWWYSESICMLIGLSYDGLSKDGTPKWCGLRNFKFRQFLSGTFFQDIIESFNINTNQWAGRYLFRRLRFLGNKSASHVITLAYLALWHGFYVGYFIMFAMEFATMIAEKQFCDTWRKISGLSFNDLSLTVRIPLQVLGAVFKFLTCGFYVQSFMLLRWRRIKVVYASVYYWPLLVFGSWFLFIGPCLSLYARRGKKLVADTKTRVADTKKNE